MTGCLERIKYFIDYKGISIRKFEIEIGFSNGAFASQLKNKKSIGSDKIENILNKYPELNANWLFTGNGEMLQLPQENANLVCEENDPYQLALKELVATQRDLILMQNEKIKAIENKKDKSNKNPGNPKTAS